jgi:hypothetical protein
MSAPAEHNTAAGTGATPKAKRCTQNPEYLHATGLSRQRYPAEVGRPGPSGARNQQIERVSLTSTEQPLGAARQQPGR